MAQGRGEKHPSEHALSLASAGAGALIGGPAGALAGRTLNIVGDEFLARALAHDEERRISGLRAAAEAHLDERLHAGERLREDDFFTAPLDVASKLSAPWGAQRPPAHEILEAIFLAAGRTYEERKLPRLAVMVVSLMFDRESPPAYAHHLVRTAEILSYRQLLLLRIFHGHTRQEGLAEGDVRSDSPTAVGMELEDLARRGLIGLNEPGEDAYPAASILEVGLTFIKTTRDGRKLVELMGLEDLPGRDIADLLDELGAATGQ